MSSPDRHKPSQAAKSPPITAPVRSSHELFGSSNEICIVHGGECYRLRLTRNGKLILTK